MKHTNLRGGGTGTLNLEEVPHISITNVQVLVRIHDAGVNPADWKVRQGYLKQLRHNGATSKFEHEAHLNS